MAVTRTFKVSGLLCAGGIVLIVAAHLAGREEPFMALGVISLVFAAPVFLVSLTRHLLRGILWRVGSRLLISYLLIGVVPLPFLLALAYLGTLLVAGQLGVKRAETALDAREAALRSAARELAPQLGSAGDAEKRARLFARLADDPTRRLSGAGFAYAPAGGPPEGSGPLGPADLVPGRWNGDSLSFVAKRDEKLLAGAVERTPAGVLVVYRMLDRPLEDELSRELRLAIHIGFSNQEKERRTGAKKRKGGITVGRGSGAGIQVTREEAEQKAEKAVEQATEKAVEKVTHFFGDAGAPAGSGPIRGRYVTWMGILDRPLVDLKTGEPLALEHLTIIINSSLAEELGQLFARSRLGSAEAGALVVRILQVLSLFTATVYMAAALLAAILVFRIARATRRLSVAFDELAKGNFAHRASLRGHDQLSELIRGFNAMSAHLAASVAARAEKEALQHELTLARDLQRRLLPSPDFRFPGVEIATDFRPAAAIGGDFYHLLAEGEERLVVVIADVSGHGLPTGIVMASAKASLSALAAAGTSTPDIFTTLDREIRETTEPRTFVTLAHARFRLKEREVDVTNAGHLYPYRVQADGTVSDVANPARPLGLELPATFRTVTAPLAPGDLWVFLSDGIVEAASPSDEEFGFARLERLLRECGGGSAAALRDRILEAWRAFTGREEPLDDRTLIVLRIEEPLKERAPGPPAPSSPAPRP